MDYSRKQQVILYNLMVQMGLFLIYSFLIQFNHFYINDQIKIDNDQINLLLLSGNVFVFEKNRIGRYNKTMKVIQNMQFSVHVLRDF